MELEVLEDIKQGMDLHIDHNNNNNNLHVHLHLQLINKIDLYLFTLHHIIQIMDKELQVLHKDFLIDHHIHLVLEVILNNNHLHIQGIWEVLIIMEGSILNMDKVLHKLGLSLHMDIRILLPLHLPMDNKDLYLLLDMVLKDLLQYLLLTHLLEVLPGVNDLIY